MTFPGRYILDADGEPVRCDDLITWAVWLERSSRDRSRIIAQDCDERDPARTVLVSTVFLGLDHQWGDGPPVLWETLVIGGVLDGEQRRYTSRADALRGHQAMCARVTATGSGRAPRRDADDEPPPRRRRRHAPARPVTAWPGLDPAPR